MNWNGRFRLGLASPFATLTMPMPGSCGASRRGSRSRVTSRWPRSCGRRAARGIRRSRRSASMKLAPCTTISVPPVAGPLRRERWPACGRGTSRKVAAAARRVVPGGVGRVRRDDDDRVVIGRDGRSEVVRHGAWWGTGATVHASSCSSPMTAIVAPREARKPSPSSATSATGDLGRPPRSRLPATGLSMRTTGRLHVGAERDEAAVAAARACRADR